MAGMNWTPEQLKKWQAEAPEERGIVGDLTTPPVALQFTVAPETDTQKLAREFEDAWSWAGGPDLVKEYKFFASEGRKWMFDYAHVESKVAIELEGGVWTGGRHTRGKGFIGDCEKYNTAALHGWTVFRIPTGGATDELVSNIAAYVADHGKLPF